MRMGKKWFKDSNITKVRYCDRQKLEQKITVHEIYDARLLYDPAGNVRRA